MSDKAVHEQVMRMGFITPMITWLKLFGKSCCHTNYPHTLWGNLQHHYLVGNDPPKYPVPCTTGIVEWGRYCIILRSADDAETFNLEHWWLQQHRSICDEIK